MRKTILFLFSLMVLNAEESFLRVHVKDASGEPVRQAHVALLQHREKKAPKSQETDTPTVDAMAVTNERGEAILRFSKEHRYRVEVRAYGFQPWNRSNFRDKQKVLDVVLAVGFFVNY